ncbi:uncharacterized protein LOC104556543 isoform X5 [Colius striatus]|uniref:uncharacterized protein LOC104556543 isoform X5 n=1 Tax=Colius striatus TaxID=57412 RepID=UPI002B1E33CE|nr:uncharacterized protein LOC104556543 isoform X5 [Colius striatus]
MGLLWLLLLLPLNLLEAAGQPCPNVTISVRRGLITIPINSTSTIVLKKWMSSHWEELFVCPGKCHKYSSQNYILVHLSQGELQLSGASAGHYRVDKSLDDSCLMHIYLDDTTLPPPATYARTPRATASSGWVVLVALVVVWIFTIT